jgi:hypothetical protein
MVCGVLTPQTIQDLQGGAGSVIHSRHRRGCSVSAGTQQSARDRLRRVGRRYVVDAAAAGRRGVQSGLDAVPPGGRGDAPAGAGRHVARTSAPPREQWTVAATPARDLRGAQRPADGGTTAVGRHARLWRGRRPRWTDRGLRRRPPARAGNARPHSRAGRGAAQPARSGHPRSDGVAARDRRASHDAVAGQGPRGGAAAAYDHGALAHRCRAVGCARGRGPRDRGGRVPAAPDVSGGDLRSSACHAPVGEPSSGRSSDTRERVWSGCRR